jgi:uncharacterized repeat protein (TIGR02543 family)
MRRVLATLVVLSLVMSMFTGVFAPMPEARAAGPAIVNLGRAGNFAILAKTGISTTGVTHVTGDIGVSPAAASFITGFGLTKDSSNTFATSSLVNGNVYSADYTPPTPANMTAAIGDMQTAYTNAAGRAAGVGPNLNLGAGTVAGQTLAPGTYTWGSNVTITTDLTLSGSADDVWLFQITGTLDIATGKQILLVGGALAKNIFWQVSDAVTFSPGSHFEGNILAMTNIAMQTGATLNGRALSQTAVTLDANIVLAPANTNSVMYTLTTTASPSAGGTIGRSPNASSYASGTVVILTAAPATGYTFTGWSGDLTGSTNPTTITMDADKSVTATFTSSTTGSGDTNGDGTVNTLDVLLAARAAAGLGALLTGSALLAADVNGDGFVNVLDVLRMARLAVGLPV